MNQKLSEIRAEVGRIIRGKNDVIVRILAAILAEGHILMEDIPGVGKTTLATTFAKTMSLTCHRVQFTPDVLPSDLLGFSLYDKEAGQFKFRKGSVFCNLFLADEINRTSPKTQSALLEVMEERQASVEGRTWVLPSPFIVIATQNPTGASGTQLLPESQMDRFMIRISMGYPAHEAAVEILKTEVWENLDSVRQVVTLEELQALQAGTKEITVHDSLYDYMVSIVEKTREHAWFQGGASPRGTIALLRMSRAMAMMEGRDFVTAEDVQRVAADVLSHRVKISNRAAGEGKSVDACVRQVLMEIKPPRL